MKNKTNKLTLLLLILMTMQSCVTLNVPSKERIASKKLSKTLDLNERIVRQYPDLRDLVHKPIDLTGYIKADSVKSILRADSLKIAKFFSEEYDPLIKQKDSLERTLSNELLNSEEKAIIILDLTKLNERLKRLRRQIPSVAFPDTTIYTKLNALLLINNDTFNIVVEHVTTVKNGEFDFSLRIPEQKYEGQIQSPCPEYKIKNPYTGYIIGFLVAVIMGALIYAKFKK